MGPRGAALCVLAIAGCGRVGFEETGDAASFGARTCASGGSLLFCDDFEGGPETYVYMHGDLALAADPVRSGNTALRTNLGSGGDYTAFLLGPELAGVVPRVSTCSWLFVPSDVMFDRSNLIQIVHVDTNEQIVVGAVDNHLLIYVYTTQSDIADNAIDPPRDRWFHLELDAVIDDTAGRVELRLDGAVVASLANIDTRPSAPFDVISYGWAWTDPVQTPGTLYFDDFSVASAPGVCP